MSDWDDEFIWDDEKETVLEGVKTGEKGTPLFVSLIETPSCCFIKLEMPQYRNQYRDSTTFSYFIDGVKAKETHTKTWGVIESAPKEITSTRSRPKINHRWVLKDPSLSDKFPPMMKREDCQRYDEEEREWYWEEEFRSTASLYELQSDSQAPEIVVHPFEIIEHLKVDEEVIYHGIKIPAISSNSNSFKKDHYTVNEEHVRYSILDKLVLPEVLLPNRPCQLTSQQTYDIIRNYVKEHIDARYAEITSDYNFCFTVKKKIALDEPQKYEVDVTPKRARKKRKETRWRKHRQLEVFEMTWIPECYKGYTPIKPFKGDNLKDLEEKISEFCEDLMGKINEPLIDCPHCHGMGVILEESRDG